MRTPTRLKSLSPCILIGALCLCLPVTVQAQILVNETFSDGERLTNDPPNSLQWTVGAHHATAANAFGALNVSSGAMTLDHNNAGETSFAAVWGHFAPGGSPAALNVGEVMTLTYDVRFSGGGFADNNASFRWALMNSNNSRVTTDFAGTNATGISSGSTFSSWDGYLGQTSLFTSPSTGSSLEARERSGSGSALFDSGQWATVSGSTNPNEPLFAADTTYTGSLTLTRTDAGIEVLAGINGVFTNPAMDVSGLVTSFDSIVFFGTNASSHNFTFSNIQLSLTPVPEPSTWIMGLAMVGMVGGFVVRRRRAAAGK